MVSAFSISLLKVRIMSDFITYIIYIYNLLHRWPRATANLRVCVLFSSSGMYKLNSIFCGNCRNGLHAYVWII